MQLMEPLTEQQEDDILTDVGYSRQQLEPDLKQLREWLDAQPHLPECRLKEKDSFLKAYLIGCKGSLETAKKKLDAYYTYRRYSDLFDERDPTQENYILKNKSCVTFIMPRLSYSKDLIVINAALEHELKDYNFLSNMRKHINLIEMRMRMQDISPSNICFLIDTKKFTASHVVLFTPTVVRDMLHVIQNVLPFRLKALIFVNAPTFMDIALNNLIKPFLSSKLKDRFQVFSSGHEEFYKFIERSVLPKEFGGDDTHTLNELNDAWAEEEVKRKDWFLKELSEKTDESKRINLEGTIGDPFFGVHGSLKKLVVD